MRLLQNIQNSSQLRKIPRQPNSAESKKTRSIRHFTLLQSGSRRLVTQTGAPHRPLSAAFTSNQWHNSL